MTKQLIIIGNGFDLACGLKSSYKDFFEDIFKERLETGDNEIGEVDNFWMEYFFQDKNITENRDIIWKDIESSIEDCVSYFQYEKLCNSYFLTIGRKNNT